MSKIYTVEINGSTEYYTTFEKAYASIADKIEEELHGRDEDEGIKALYVLKSNPILGEIHKLDRTARISWINVN